MTPLQLEALKTFCRRIVQEAWQGGLDSGDTQQLACDLGLCVTEPATQADVDEGFEGEAGDTIFRLVPWVKE